MLTSTAHTAVIRRPYNNEPLLLHVHSAVCIVTRDTSFALTGRSSVGSCIGTDFCIHNAENITPANVHQKRLITL